MKKTIILVVLVTIALIISCKDVSKKNSQNEYINNPSHLEDSASIVSDKNKNIKIKDYTIENDSLLKMDKEDLKKMYTHLGMKEEQIQLFEAKDWKYTFDLELSENPINIEELWNQRKDNLKEVLTDRQYEQYLMWKKDLDRKVSK